MKTAIFHNHPIHYKHLLFQEMKMLGLEFTVFFAGTQSRIRNEEIGLSQDLYKYRFLFSGHAETAAAIPRMWNAWRALSKMRPEVIISCGYERPENWAVWFWALFWRVPVILWYESNEFDWPRHWLKELPKRLFMKGLAGAHVYGKTNRDYLVKLGMDRDSILIKRAVVNVRRFDVPADQKSYRPESITRLLFIGRLSPEKNLPFLIDCFANAKKEVAKPFTLTIVGTGPDQQEIRRQIADLNLADSVTLAGYVPQAELKPYLLNSDFFVLPSTREPWGLVALEAMLTRVPVLLSTQCGCCADLISSDTGWKFAPADGAELTRLLLSLPDVAVSELTRMGAAAHSVALEYSPEACAKAIAESIRAIPEKLDRTPLVTRRVLPTRS